MLSDTANQTVIGCNLKSDINLWKDGEVVSTLRGHCEPITKVMNFNNIAIITGDMEGRLLAWNPATGEATRPNGILQKHKIAIA